MTAQTSPEHIKNLITHMEERSDVDPDSFAVDVKLLEKELLALETPSSPRTITLKSIIHGVLATAYSQMKNSHISDFDAETQEAYSRLAKEHFSHVLDDMATLAKEQSKTYSPLIQQGKGSKYYGHNMLAVMLDFVERYWYIFEESGQDRGTSLAQLFAKARQIYQAGGDRNSDTMLRLRELQNSAHYTPEQQQHYCQQLEALRDSTKNIEAGKLVANTLELEVNSIMATSINIKVADNILANTPFSIKLESKNATKATLQVLLYNGRDKQGQLRQDGKQLLRRTYSLSTPQSIKQGRAVYMAVTDSCSDSLQLEAGHYVLVASTTGDTSVSELNITTLHHAVFFTPGNRAFAYTLDRITGQPLSGINLLLYKNYSNDTYDKFQSDKNGKIVFPVEVYQRMRAVRDLTAIGTHREDATEPSHISYYHSFYTNKESVHGNIFTDRGIYRPGQTIHVSALLYSMLGDETVVVKQGKYLFSLRTPDGKETLSDTLSPNLLGSVSFDFTLPTHSKLGNYQLTLKELNNVRRGWNYIASQGIQVEEYKRTTYDVTFQKDTTTYAPEDSITANLKAETFAGVPVAEAKVKYTIEATKQYFWMWGVTKWQRLESAEVETKETGEVSIPFRPSSYASVQEYMNNTREGERLLIRINATVTDNAGETHQAVINYVIPLKPKKQTEEEKPDPLQLSKEKAYPGESIDIDYTPEDKDAYIFYYALAGEKVIDQIQTLVNGTLHRRLTCKKEWGDGATVIVFYVKNGRIHEEQKTITIPKPDKKLDLSWKTFRDRLVPGQQETWTLTLKDKQGQPVSGAELLASMYDASLDELSDFNWHFSIPFSTRITSLPHVTSQPTYGQTLWLSYQPAIKSLMPTEFDLLEGYQGMGRYRIYGLGNSPMMRKTISTSLGAIHDAASPVLMANAAPESVTDMANYLEDAIEAKTKESAADNPTEGSGQVLSLRSNFSETAFFLPHLTTDSEGNAQISFTLPESLTEWKFMGFAHTEDVRYGLITASVVASKDFMVQPQLPRFLRTSDQATIQARIFNRSEVNIDGKATLRMLSAKDETTVVYAQTVPFMVELGGTAIVTFNIPQGRLTEDVVCEIAATDGSCSDGERTLLPVLSTKEIVTENIPFYLDGAGTKRVDLTTLYNGNSPTATDRTLTIGYTDNPALDVFRSLRALQLPQHDNAPCYAAALYSNRVMLSLHHRLSALGDSVIQDFDPDEAEQRAVEALQKLKELQLGDGSWCWFKGMGGSAYITLAVAEHLHKLQAYIQRYKLADPDGIEQMLNQALNFLKEHELKEFARRKQQKEELQPTEFDLRYMAICKAKANALSLSNQHSLMLGTYLNELAGHMDNLTIYGRAQGACILHKFGRTAAANKFTESVKHYLVHKPGFGRYFATDRAYYSWQDYRIPTQLAAMRCLSLAKTNEQENLHDMQLWLLRQKQTQVWDNPLNGIDVADYLLTLSPDETVRKAEVPKMKLDNQIVALKAEGNRYISPTQERKNASLQELSVEKHTPGISWGYVRGTFMEEAEKVNTYTTGELSVERKLYLKKGEEWVELEEQTLPFDKDGNTQKGNGDLQVGSILRVRHIIHADRDMDFISVTSRHAACMEPQRTRSGYQWVGTRGCYLEMHDTETTIFFDWFRRGTTTVDLDYYITRTGLYLSGTVQAQCDYAPEFGGHSKTYKIIVK